MRTFKIGERVHVVRRDEDYGNPTTLQTIEAVDDADWVRDIALEEAEESYYRTQLLKENEVIHCKTKAEYDYLMKELEEIGYKIGYSMRHYAHHCVYINSSGVVDWCFPDSSEEVVPFTELFGDFAEGDVVEEEK